MSDSPSANDGSLGVLVDELLRSYRDDSRGQHVNRRFLPSRAETLEILDLFLQLLYPGYFGKQDLTDENVPYHVGATLTVLRDKLERQVERCLLYAAETAQREASPDLPRCRRKGHDVANELLRRLPGVRRKLLLDVQAAVDGDPAATSLDEIILAYPGLLAITVQRLAHEVYKLGVPLMSRIMTEWAHTQTGADIHAGAVIGESFFLDHATGVVVGETTIIGDRVKLYQGVTLGALSIPHDASLVRGKKRHPTVESDVTIYANAIVLGGETVIGRGCIIGGSVFLTKSVAPGHTVAIEAPKLRLASPEDRARAGKQVPDFEI